MSAGEGLDEAAKDAADIAAFFKSEIASASQTVRNVVKVDCIQMLQSLLRLVGGLPVYFPIAVLYQAGKLAHSKDCSLPKCESKLDGPGQTSVTSGHSVGVFVHMCIHACKSDVPSQSPVAPCLHKPVVFRAVITVDGRGIYQPPPGLE
ncbi:tRNA N6-adenosine threonylcarbamoyltransferase [Dissostichus eleginoides]|uniref:tRNA N6-adenosine threonylcarbamoyltransferase n=1 Tax=Dissostichus eleginoides TaxID=100907 RepID=A0AAD9C854_DISEL|nr:tRNA N6-adenosine threonylcarbamoyltransferase [Dissostichus eleginoides]